MLASSFSRVQVLCEEKNTKVLLGEGISLVETRPLPPFKQKKVHPPEMDFSSGFVLVLSH